MAKGKNQHVVKNSGTKSGWSVKGAGNSKATKVTSTKKAAIKVATQIAKNQHSDTKIHNMDGKISSGNSYGNDPCPPKDKK